MSLTKFHVENVTKLLLVCWHFSKMLDTTNTRFLLQDLQNKRRDIKEENARPNAPLCKIDHTIFKRLPSSGWHKFGIWDITEFYTLSTFSKPVSFYFLDNWTSGINRCQWLFMGSSFLQKTSQLS